MVERNEFRRVYEKVKNIFKKKKHVHVFQQRVTAPPVLMEYQIKISIQASKLAVIDKVELL